MQHEIDMIIIKNWHIEGIGLVWIWWDLNNVELSWN